MGIPSFRCHKCGDKFGTVDELHEHKKIHPKVSSRNKTVKATVSIIDDDGKEYKLKGLQNVKVVLDSSIPEGVVELRSKKQ